jgi:DHA2 family multidrug resistance protein
MVHRNDLVENLDVNNFNVQQRVTGMQHAFMAKGIPSDIALKDAYKALDFNVTRQAAVLSYMDVFLYLGIMFLICVPFMLLVKGKRNQKVDLGEAMH